MKVNIFDYGMNGEGVAKIDGKIILVPNALMGEDVETEIVQDYKNYALAKLINVITPSPERTRTKCNYAECGGCNLNHMSYTEQLKFKQLLVYKTIKKITGIDAQVNPTVASNNQFNYRNKASFVVQNNIGYYKQNSHQIVPVESCCLVDENINKILKIFKNWLNLSENCIKNLVIRALNNQILVGVVTNTEIDLHPFYTLLQAEFNKIGLYQIINTRKDSVVLSGKVKHVAGIKEISLNNLGINYTIDILSFHQTNEYIQNQIYNYVMDSINKNDIVINAYSGAGLLTAILSKKAKTVYGVELSKPAHTLAEKLKSNNNLANVININSDFIKFITTKNNADVVVLDPPKKGCGKGIEKINAKQIIYISCNPISLAKDLQILTKKYIIESVTPFDMFPNTVSIETVVKLRRRNDT